MNRRDALVALALPALGSFSSCAGVSFVPDRAHGFLPRTRGNHRYQVYLPAAWRKDRAFPVIVYLHGGGERGDDGLRPTQVGLGPVAFASNGSFPFIVLFPQCKDRSFWAAAEMERRVFQAIDDAICELGADPARVYLTGNSLGGYGTWILGARHAGRFAALVPLCGGVVPPPGGPKTEPGSLARAPDPYAAAAQAIGRTPVWAFHGGSDWLVPPKITRKMVAALRAAGNQARHSQYPGVGHEVEEVAYREPGLWQWLLAQRLTTAPISSC